MNTGRPSQPRKPMPGPHDGAAGPARNQKKRPSRLSVGELRR